ncbi:MAG: TetR/AcrR family transcriptional regulator [Oscillospiraceae bacterium]|jgi:AcrR family transcriptional regulator|nr:TetR/AcrR family transcriptional regulator [Oscillospiraceae bacterium]
MPPEAKFSAAEIIAAGMEIAKEQGIEAVTARELGKRLGSSSSPIFTVFKNMEEVHSELIKTIRTVYDSYIETALKSEHNAFKAVGTQYIRFASEQPKLFEILFMSTHEEIPSIREVLSGIDDNYGLILRSVQEPHKLDEPSAKKIYRHMWVYTHGIAALIATKMCSFSGEEISVMLTEMFVGLLKNIKTEENSHRRDDSND